MRYRLTSVEKLGSQVVAIWTSAFLLIQPAAMASSVDREAEKNNRIEQKRQKERARAQQLKADEQKKEADKQQSLADKKRDAYEKQQARADKERAEYDQQQARADKEKADFEREQARADRERSDANREQTQADKERNLAESEQAKADKEWELAGRKLPVKTISVQEQNDLRDRQAKAEQDRRAQEERETKAAQDRAVAEQNAYAAKKKVDNAKPVAENAKQPEKFVLKNVRSTTPPPPSETRGAVRLPRAVVPDAYRIFIEPDLENKQFSGEETIFLTVHNSTKDVVLNAVGLDIAESEIAPIGGEGHGRWIAPERVIEEKEKQQVCFRFQQNLKPGKYEFRMRFGGKLNEKLEGFYVSTFTDDKGEKRMIACTQLEATDARKVFPCFDEPDMKATFKITLAIDSGLTAISNASIQFEKTEGRSGKRQVTFNETPKMSTYLVAMIVGPFESSEPVKSNGVEIRVWATPGHKDLCGFGRTAAEKMLPYFESYFGVKYPLEKLDLIAIPDFAAGAMENLGAITFRETRLLVDEKAASTATRQEVAWVIAHEMAHMWFGDLVTMKWWDDLWLNEAFATWMSVKALDSYKPDWHPWDLFVRDRAPALASDSLASTRPIYAEVKDPADAEEMFDEITYEKGASVLRMLERFLGEDTYMKGIQKYIREHQYGNAQTSELWDALADVSGKPVAAIMQDWVYSAGFPYLTVEPKTVRTKDSTPGTAFNLLQDFFTVSPPPPAIKGKISTSEKLNKAKIWQIPITSRVLVEGPGEETKLVRTLLTDKKGVLTNVPTGGPLLLNAYADGYFRVQYDQSMFDELGKKAQSTMTASERYQLLNDAWAFVEAGTMPISQYMSLTAYFKDESDPNVIELLVSQIATLDWFIKDDSRDNFAAFVRDRFGPLARKLGWEPQEGESELTQVLRSHVLIALGTFGHDKSTIAESRKFWDIYQEQPQEINPNLYEAIVAIMAYNGDKIIYDEMVEQFKNATTPEAKLRNLYGLAYFRTPELQQRTLSLAMSDDVKTQDAPHVVLNLMKTTSGRETGWAFVKQNWKDLEARYPVHLFPRIVNGATSFVSDAQAADLEKFLADHPMKTGRRVSAKVIERVRSNVKLNERNGDSLAGWLKEFRTRESALN